MKISFLCHWAAQIKSDSSAIGLSRPAILNEMMKGYGEQAYIWCFNYLFSDQTRVAYSCKMASKTIKFHDIEVIT